MLCQAARKPFSTAESMQAFDSLRQLSDWEGLDLFSQRIALAPRVNDEQPLHLQIMDGDVH